MALLTIAVTIGDPAGIGPEIIAKALGRVVAASGDDVRVIVVGHEGALRRGLECAGSELEFVRVTAPEHAPPLPAVGLLVPPRIESLKLDALSNSNSNSISNSISLPIGQISAAAGKVAGECIDAAIDLALAGQVQAIVTAPIHKAAVRAAGYTYPGHTERLAERAGTETVMCMVGAGLMVGFVTTHIALRDVAAALTTEKIISAGKLTAAAMPALGAAHGLPLGVLGLNPHASDGGRFGDEEQRVIEPAVAALCSEGGAGIKTLGPLVPDVAFRQHLEGRYGALLALYHDQGNIVFKTLAFDEGVNVTLGLPFVRTSPDHGTAFDIAGQGVASERSMLAAFDLAVRLARDRSGHSAPASLP